MIDRAQVLHVAQLARLELSEQEIDSMAADLDKVLEHIAKIDELDLEGVPPTFHVVDVANALRPDEPHASLERETVLRAAPEVAGDGFAVPSPQA